MEQHQGSTYLDLTILSASDLQRGWFSGDQTVAIAWIDPSLKKSTGVTSGGGCNVQWNEQLTLPLSDADAIARHGKRMTIEIRAQGALGRDNLLGTVNVPLVEIALDSQKEANSTQTYQIVLPSGKRHGSVSFLGKVVESRSSGFSATLPSAPPVSFLNGNYGGSCEWVSHPSQVYPPSYPQQNSPASCAPCLYVESVAPYPSQQICSAPYPPPTSMYQHPNPPVAYPPTFVYPPGAPHFLETPYPPPPSYPYPNHSSPLYPPPYPPRHAPPSYGGGPYAVF